MSSQQPGSSPPVQHQCTERHQLRGIKRRWFKDMLWRARLLCSRLRRSHGEDALWRLTYIDSLTRLPNRGMLEKRAQRYLQSGSSDSPLAILLFDLDDFRSINDSLGHELGDRLLEVVARRLLSNIREIDTLSRPGGDEFALLLPHSDADAAALTAQRCLDLLAQPFVLGEHELTLSCSVGIAMYPQDGKSLQRLYTNADIAMYRVKQSGRNNYAFYAPEMQSSCLRQLQLANALRRAILDDQLALVYQPQHSIQDGSLVGMEVLLRWHHPDLGVVSPVEFIPIAESSGQILALGDWVLHQALSDMREWHLAGIAPPRVAINVSAVQFRQADLHERIFAKLREMQLPPEVLELELTESITMEQPDRAAAVIERLHAAGIQVSIDDFGTGYSSLNQLKRFRISTLKIDKSFVSDIDRDRDSHVIAKTIIRLAQGLGLRCVAEGLEQPGQLKWLRNLGCEHAQGFLLSQPLGRAQTRNYLAHLCGNRQQVETRLRQVMPALQEELAIGGDNRCIEQGCAARRW